MQKATWTNNKRIITGHYIYYWPSDSFVIYLNSKDRITGEYKKLIVHGDIPEWGNWKFKKMNII